MKKKIPETSLTLLESLTVFLGIDITFSEFQVPSLLRKNL